MYKCYVRVSVRISHHTACFEMTTLLLLRLDPVSRGVNIFSVKLRTRSSSGLWPLRCERIPSKRQTSQCLHSASAGADQELRLESKGYNSNILNGADEVLPWTSKSIVDVVFLIRGRTLFKIFLYSILHIPRKRRCCMGFPRDHLELRTRVPTNANINDQKMLQYAL
jgi:hypothetical protein